MIRPILSLALLLAACAILAASAPADKVAQAILDRAIKALGGEEKLSKIKAATWKAKSKITSQDIEITDILTVQGLDHFRSESEFEFDGRKTKGVDVFAENKGWQRAYGNTRQKDEKALAFQKRSIYLLVVPMTLVPLKNKSFKVQVAGEKKIGEKSAVGLKVTGPDDKDFTLFFDRDSGLPLMLTAKLAFGPGGDEYTQETTFADYKEFAGIKKATKIVWKVKGEKFMESHISEFRVLDKVDPKTFEEPK